MLKALVPISWLQISLCANRHASKGIEDNGPFSPWERRRFVSRRCPAGTAVGDVCPQS